MLQSKSDAEIWAATALSAVALIILGAGWLVGKVDALVAIPALLACAGVDIRKHVTGRKGAASAAPLIIVAGAVAATQLL